MAQIADDVLDVLRAATVEGDTVKLAGQLDRALYEQVDKVLKRLGGKWNRKAGGHLARWTVPAVAADFNEAPATRQLTLF